MKITRENHANFMTKVMPLLTLAYFVQAYFYLNYVPLHIAQEVVGCLGICLVGVFLYYFIYDRFHEVVLHQTYFEVKFTPLQIHQECLYREIVDVEISSGKRKFQNLKIHLKSGEVMKIAHVDDAQSVRKYLLERT